LYVAKQQSEVLAGIVLYLINDVAHVQYISASNEGKAIGALDLLFHEVIHHKLKDYTYFDFGRSTENNGEKETTNFTYNSKNKIILFYFQAKFDSYLS